MSDHEVLDREDWAIARKIFLARQARFTRSGERATPSCANCRSWAILSTSVTPAPMTYRLTCINKVDINIIVQTVNFSRIGGASRNT